MAAPSQGASSPRARSGSSSGAAIRVDGVKEFRRELKKLENPRYWSREFGRTNRAVAEFAAQKARRLAASGGDARLGTNHRKMVRHFASHIRGRGTVTGARIGLRGAGNPISSGALWGAKGRSGWYLERSLETRRLDSSGRVIVEYGGGRDQFPRWVGNDWDVAKLNQGPYAINPALYLHMPQIVDKYGEAVDDLARRAGFRD